MAMLEETDADVEEEGVKPLVDEAADVEDSECVVMSPLETDLVVIMPLITDSVVIKLLVGDAEVAGLLVKALVDAD